MFSVSKCAVSALPALSIAKYVTCVVPSALTLTDPPLPGSTVVPVCAPLNVTWMARTPLETSPASVAVNWIVTLALCQPLALASGSVAVETGGAVSTGPGPPPPPPSGGVTPHADCSHSVLPKSSPLTSVRCATAQPPSVPARKENECGVGSLVQAWNAPASGEIAPSFDTRLKSKLPQRGGPLSIVMNSTSYPV